MAPDPFDTATLSWVKDEIDLALKRAGEALARHAAAPGEAAWLDEASRYLHQAGGALTLVGLTGVTRFAEYIEARLTALARPQDNQNVVAVSAAAGAALAALRRYLDDLMTGQPDQPLRLYPSCRALALAAGEPAPARQLLFVPDPAVQPPRRHAEPLTPTRLAALRMGFARGLAKWRSGDRRGLAEMRNAIVGLDKGGCPPALRTLWWVARPWLDALAAQDDPAPDDTLLTDLDRSVEVAAQNSPADIPNALLAGLLCDIAVALPGDARLEEVRTAYRLAELVPDETLSSAPHREACRAPLATAMEEWERFGQGQAIALMRFHEIAQLLDASARDSHDVELARLTAGIVDFIARLRQQPEHADAATALEVAGALVLVQEAIEQEGVRTPGDTGLFAAAVGEQLDRLAASGQDAGVTPRAHPAYQHWCERRVIARAAREIRASLEAIEPVLDAFFASPAASSELAVAKMQLHQVAGAFAMIDESAAAQAAAQAEAWLADCAAGTLPATHFATLAERIATLAQHADLLAQGQPDRSLLDTLLAEDAGGDAVPPAPTLSPDAGTGGCIDTGSTDDASSHSASSTRRQSDIDEARNHAAMLRDSLAGQTAHPSPTVVSAARSLADLSARAGFDPVRTLARALEQALVRHVLANAAPDDAARMLFARSAGALEGMIGALAEGRTSAVETALTDALASLAPTVTSTPTARMRQPSPADGIDPDLATVFLEEADEQLPQLDADLNAWRETPDNAGIGRQIARLLHTFKGGARMCGAMALGELAHDMEARIEQALVAGRADPALQDDLRHALDHAHRLVDALRPPGQAGESTATPSAAQLRLRADLVDHLVSDAGEIAISRNRIEGSIKHTRGALTDLTENVSRLRSQLREFEILAETGMQSRLGSSDLQRRDFDPLELDRFTRLQELTRMMTESVGDVATVQHALLRQVDTAEAALTAQARQTRELSHALLRVRMVPFASVAERLHRVVRQTSHELGRPAALDIVGGESPVDRTLLERMVAPLEHLLRNAVAHGIETPEQRSACGKSAMGRITLTLSPTDNDITLALADDGGGLDLAAIRRRAIGQRLLAENAEPDERDLVEMIFRPGFSTVDHVSEISGRGIGLDVVRDQVARLGGRVGVATEAGHGTRFEIVLPLTLALIQVMLVGAAGQTWAIPAALVEEARELDAGELGALRTAGMVERAGRRYPWHRLPRLYGMADDDLPQETGWLLLMQAGGERIALEVDTLTQNQEVVVKPLIDQIARVPGLTGATVLPEGSVALIVNPVALTRRPATTVQSPAIAMPRPHVDAATVLVVDDSLTVRKICGRLLERAGYRVMTARDGFDALEQIGHVRPNVILADIEMPRMDGFELVRTLRDDPRLADLPVIMITSRIAEKHRQVARELGVRHYLGKPYDEEMLLGLVARLAGPNAPRQLAP